MTDLLPPAATPAAKPTTASPVPPAIAPLEVYRRLLTRAEVALLDVREEGPYARAHPLFAASLPLSQIELQVLDRAPRRSALIVVYDEDGRLAPRAYDVLRRLGYEDVRILEDGLNGWRRAGLELFQDVNSASKAFGELVEARRHTPSVSAEDLQRRLQAGEDLVVLDARRFDEFRNMSIPTAISTPGAELVLRADALAPHAKTQIIVNCAGRTRSIIGTQSLVNAGFEGRVSALRNGTIGWTLAGLELDHGANRRWDDVPAADIETARNRAREVAYRAGVRHIDLATLALLRADAARTTYCFDVRQPEEFETGHVAAFRNVPGGQLVQETDVSAPVRGARIVLHDPLGGRADMTASWLAQMGWDTYVLEASAPMSARGTTPSRTPPLPAVTSISPERLAAQLGAEAVTVIDLSSSPDRARGHIPGSWFAIRAELASALAALDDAKPLVLCSADGRLAAFASADVEALSGRRPAVRAGGLRAWRAAGWPTEVGLGRALSPADDVYKRPYEGVGNGHAAMQAYLDWEYGLVEQLARDRSHGFVVI
jgi:rhodanese-related sulfurtransferase